MPERSIRIRLIDIREEIAGIRNVLRHEFRRVDSDVLWAILTEDLGDLDRAAEALLAGQPE